MTTAARERGHPWFAALYDLVSRSAERRVLAPLRRWVVGEATGEVLEIGAGTGHSFPFYRAAQQIVATEPDPYMRRRARQRAATLVLSIEIERYPAEALPFPDASFDTVVSTLVLCTVGDLDRALQEIRRVLRPGGTFRFIEHVRADGWRGRVQDAIAPVWCWCGAGCHPNRRTGEDIETARLRLVRLERHRLPPGMPLLAGVAVRP